jgi:ubiquinone/menaquinone biosynthesis C-methylase UbiE
MTLRGQYDVWHQRVFESDPGHDDASSPWYKLVRERIGTVKDLRILEVACGRGGFVRELARAGAQVTGCDFSLSALRVGQSKLEQAEGTDLPFFVQGDVQNLPFADESFDLLVSCETIEHVPDVTSAMREMWRVVRYGGLLFLTTPNYSNFMGLYDLYARFRHPKRRDDQPFDRRQWFMQIRSYVRSAGWKIMYSDGTVHQLPILPKHNPLPLPILESNLLIRRLLSPFAFHYFLVAHKGASN